MTKRSLSKLRLFLKAGFSLHMFLFCYNKKRRPTVSLKQAVESATQVVVSDNLSVNDKLLGLFAAVQIGKLTGGEVMLDYLHRPQNSLFHEKSQQMILKKFHPYWLKLSEKEICKTYLIMTFRRKPRKWQC